MISVCRSARKSMETRSQQDEERANVLEVQVDEAKVIAEEADRKYEEVVICYFIVHSEISEICGVGLVVLFLLKISWGFFFAKFLNICGCRRCVMSAMCVLLICK